MLLHKTIDMIWLLFLGLHYGYCSFTHEDLKSGGYVVNIINHTGLVIASTLWLSIFDVNESVYSYNLWSETLSTWLVNYIFYDLIKLFILSEKRFNTSFLIHHVATMAFFSYLNRYTLLHCFIPILTMFELSSIPLNVTFWLKHNHPEVNHLITLSKAIFAFTFVTVRLLWGGSMCLWCLNKLHEEVVDPDHFSFVFTFAMLFLTLHAYWVYRLFVVQR
jgi:hypothetical protein